MLDPIAFGSCGIAEPSSSTSEGVVGGFSDGRTPGSQTPEDEPGGVSVSGSESSFTGSEFSRDLDELGDGAMNSLETPGEVRFGAFT